MGLNHLNENENEISEIPRMKINMRCEPFSVSKRCASVSVTVHRHLLSCMWMRVKNFCIFNCWLHTIFPLYFALIQRQRDEDSLFKLNAQIRFMSFSWIQFRLNCVRFFFFSLQQIQEKRNQNIFSSAIEKCLSKIGMPNSLLEYIKNENVINFMAFFSFPFTILKFQRQNAPFALSLSQNEWK